MQYANFRDNFQLSRLGVGVMRMPVTNQGRPFNWESEVFLGKALSKYSRDSYYLADKL